VVSQGRVEAMDEWSRRRHEGVGADVEVRKGEVTRLRDKGMNEKAAYIPCSSCGDTATSVHRPPSQDSPRRLERGSSRSL